MIWLAWRRQRHLLLISVLLVAAFSVWLILAGLHEETLWTTLGRAQAAGCRLSCGSYPFTHWNNYFLWALCVIPGLVGLLLGAPLVAAEIEHGTNRLVWTQSISRWRWLSSKVAVSGLVVLALAAALIPLADWWLRAIHGSVPGAVIFGTDGSDVLPWRFDVSGIVVIGYAVFAFMLGVLLGVLLRHAAWALAAGIPLFAGARLLVRQDFRASLVPPVTRDVATPAFSGLSLPHRLIGWVIHSGLVPVGRTSPAPGQTWSTGAVRVLACFNDRYRAANRVPTLVSATMTRCERSLGFHTVVQYQPASHFWALQAVELACFLAGALVLLGATVVLVRRWRA